MKYRNLRIAWSVACGILCLLLIGLWVRSYWCIDTASFVLGGKSFAFWSEPGRAKVVYLLDDSSRNYWYFRSGMLVDSEYDPIVFRCNGNFRTGSVICAHWLVAIPIAMLAPISWLPWRFSLRTLLIAITILALALGLITTTSR
jgi:hypothetical protein